MSFSNPGNAQYIIQQGDSLNTLWDLADQNGMLVEDIFTANPGVDFNNLVVGQAISLPDPPPSSPPSEHHRRTEYHNRRREQHYKRPYPYRPPVMGCPNPYYVQPGDSLYSIAGRFRISVDQIIAANPYINFGIPLQIGQVICLPF